MKRITSASVSVIQHQMIEARTWTPLFPCTWQ